MEEIDGQTIGASPAPTKKRPRKAAPKKRAKAKASKPTHDPLAEAQMGIDALQHRLTLGSVFMREGAEHVVTATHKKGLHASTATCADVEISHGQLRKGIESGEIVVVRK